MYENEPVFAIVLVEISPTLWKIIFIFSRHNEDYIEFFELNIKLVLLEYNLLWKLSRVGIYTQDFGFCALV